MATTNLGLVGTIDWTDWIRGALSATISGGSNAIITSFGTMAVDPADFNFMHYKIYAVMGFTFLFSALLELFRYLKVKPIPEYKKTTEIEERSPHSTTVTSTGTGDGAVEERSPHTTKVTRVVEEVKPAGVTTTVIDPPKTTITEDTTNSAAAPNSADSTSKGT